METNEPFGNGQRMMSPITEPGQFFFDQSASVNMNKMLNEIITINSNVPPFENNVVSRQVFRFVDGLEVFTQLNEHIIRT